MSDVKALRQELQKTGKYMMQYELAWGNAGNISARTKHDQYLITASGTFLGELEETDLVECSLTGGTVELAQKKPSKEMPMHSAVYEERPDIGAVLHAAPFYSMLVACSGIDVPSNLFVETMYYLERVEWVGYHHPGSESLGEGVREKAKQANVLFLENHGVLVYDTTIREARMSLQTLEMACRMLVESRSANLPIRGLTAEIETDFIERAGYKPRRSWPKE